MPPRLRPDVRILLLDEDRYQVLLPTGAALAFDAPGRAREAAARLAAGDADAEVERALAGHAALAEAPLDAAEAFLTGGAAPLLPPRSGRVLLLGGGAVAAAARAALADLATPCAVGDAAAVDAAGANDLVLVALDALDAPLLLDVNARALARGVPFLPAGFLEPRRLAVGPLVVPGETACYRCYLDRRLANALNRDALRRAIGTPPLPEPHAALPAVAAVAGALAAADAARFLRGVPPPSLGVAVSLGLDRWDAAHDRVLKAPRCPACSRLVSHPEVEPWTPS